MSNKTSVEQVFTQLADEGYVNHENEAAARAVLGERRGEDSPWYVQGLAGCGGWIAAMFFFSFAGCWISLLGSSLWEAPLVLGTMFILTGLGALVGTLRLRRNTQSMVAKQFALAVTIAAQILVSVGLYVILDDSFDGDLPVVAISLAVIAMQIPLLYYYEDALLRFLSVIAIVVACNAIVYAWSISGGLSVIVGAAAVGTVVLWSQLLPTTLEAAHFDVLHPVSYALPVGIFGSLIYELVESHYADTGVLTLPYLTTLVLLGLTLWVELRVIQDYDVSLTSPITYSVLAMTAVIALPSLLTPGILAGVLVAVLGFQRRDLLLRGIAYVFLLGFVIEFYYTLDTTLLTKSIIMAATGAVMLACRFGFRQLLPVKQAMSQTEGIGL